MVLNQLVIRSPGTRIGLLGGVFVLSLAAGCQMLSRDRPTEASPTPVTRPAADAAPAAPENAVEAAIARAGTEAAAPAEAAAPVIKSNAPLSYTVKRGDTLWDISAMYLRDPWLWPEIWHVNPAVQNPHLIYPGDVLNLAYGANGQPQISLVRGNALRVEPLVRSTPLDGPIATIPYDAIRSFLGKPSIVSKDDLRNAPHVAAIGDRHVVAGSGHDVYVKGLQDRGPGRYSIVRVGSELRDPENGKVLGYMGTYTASAGVDRTGKVTKARILESARETTAGDLLFAEDLQSVSTDIVPRAPPASIDGQIMAVVDGVSLIGQYQVVAINRGAQHGLETGHVLAIDQKGEVIPDQSCRRSSLAWCIGKTVRLPDERAGTLLVFKTYDRMSYGLIVSATVPVRIADRVRTP